MHVSGSPREWSFDAAQTNQVLVSTTATQRIWVTFAQAGCANSNTVDVALRLGFSSTGSLPTVTENDLTGATGVFFSHPGIARGGGAIAANGGAIIAAGQPGDDLLITSSVPTGGVLRLVMMVNVIDEP